MYIRRYRNYEEEDNMLERERMKIMISIELMKNVQALHLNTKTETWRKYPKSVTISYNQKSVTARVGVCYSTCELPPT